MKSLKSRLSNGVSTITFRHLVPKIRITKDFGFGVQKGGNGEYLGCQGRRRESYTLLGKFSIEKSYGTLKVG